jgi:hypothetical protein
MRVQATAWADGGSGPAGGGALRLLLLAAVAVAVLVAAAAALGSLRDTVLLSSPEVREAQARQMIAESNLRTAQLNREATTTRAQGAAEATWEPWTVGAEHLAVMALLGAVPVGLLLVLAAGGLLLRRHMSLPTADGRVPLVGLDREFSLEALKSSGPVYQALRVSTDTRISRWADS